jgi:hypothetical protein
LWLLANLGRYVPQALPRRGIEAVDKPTAFPQTGIGGGVGAPSTDSRRRNERFAGDFEGLCRYKHIRIMQAVITRFEIEIVPIVEDGCVAAGAKDSFLQLGRRVWFSVRTCQHGQDQFTPGHCPRRHQASANAQDANIIGRPV